MAAVAAVVVVVRAVRSAGNSFFGLSDDWGRSDAAPIIWDGSDCSIRVYAPVGFAYNRAPRRGYLKLACCDCERFLRSVRSF